MGCCSPSARPLKEDGPLCSACFPKLEEKEEFINLCKNTLPKGKVFDKNITTREIEFEKHTIWVWL